MVGGGMIEWTEGLKRVTGREQLVIGEFCCRTILIGLCGERLVIWSSGLGGAAAQNSIARSVDPKVHRSTWNSVSSGCCRNTWRVDERILSGTSHPLPVFIR